MDQLLSSLRQNPDLFKFSHSKRKLKLTYLEDNSQVDDQLLNNFIKTLKIVCPHKNRAMLILEKRWYVWHDSNFNMVCFQKAEHY